MNRILTVVLGVVLSFGGGGMLASAGTSHGNAASSDARAWSQRPERALVREGEFEVEVLVGGVPLQDLYARGRRYVEAQAGEEYALRIRNPLPVRVAVALSVDGLSTIDARRSSSWDASKWVIEPYQTIVIEGWQMSSERARKFYFTTERDSYAARLGRASDLGIISAVFYREVAPAPVPVTPPVYREEGRPQTKRRGTSQDSAKSQDSMRAEGRAPESAGTASRSVQRDDGEYAATGIGRSVGYYVRWINLRLERRPVAEVSVRYEYRDALYKLGVLPRPPYRDGDGLKRREGARGFEDRRYSPEP